MKPYFAILFDSLLESVRSKVLWILLVCWTLILAAIFPLSITSGESFVFTFASLVNRESAKKIMDSLAAASNGKGTRAQRAVYAKLDPEFQSLLQQRQKNKRRIAVGILIDSLNKVLKSEDLYDEQAWPTAIKRPDIKPLIEKQSRSSSEAERLNRRLIDLAFQGNIGQANGQAAWVTYAGIKLGGALPFTEKQIRPFIETGIFPLVMRLGLGVVAMFVAIIITSSMIPDMFQTGSLHLLLSKPLSRSLLFLTKYLGGCIFVAINILYLLIGLYLYAGIQLRIWNVGILWCVPLFIFIFMIFYSVSALVGLIWKNPIICVVVTAVFWGACFAVGLIHWYINVFANLQPQSVRILSIGDQVITTTQQGRLRFWDATTSRWQTAYGEQDGRKVLGPVWLPNQKAIYFARSTNAPFGISTGDGAQTEFAHLPELVDADDKSFSSKRWEDGRMDSGPELPSDAQQLLRWRDTFVVLNENGIYRFNPENAVKSNDEISIPWLNFGVAS